MNMGAESRATVPLRRFVDSRGRLTIVDACPECLGEIQRVSWIHPDCGGSWRSTRLTGPECVVALSGAAQISGGLSNSSATVDRDKSAGWFGAGAITVEARGASTCLFLGADALSNRRGKAPSLPAGSYRRVHLPSTHHDGAVEVAATADALPFAIERVYYIDDVARGSARGGHAHRELCQLVACTSGSMEVRLDDGVRSAVIQLERPDQALLIGPMVWRELVNFAADTVCVVLASSGYNEQDYIRDYAAFAHERSAMSLPGAMT